MVTTLGFSVRAELAHHCQGQPQYNACKVYFLKALRLTNLTKLIL